MKSYDYLIDKLLIDTSMEKISLENTTLTSGYYFYEGDRRARYNGAKKEKNNIKNIWQQKYRPSNNGPRQINNLYPDLISKIEEGLPSEDDIRNLPPYSFYIKFDLTLKTNFFSKSDSPFFITDNFLTRDKALNIPVIKSTTWKGNLRWMALKNFLDNYENTKNINNANKERKQIIRLFGNENNQVIEFLNKKFTGKEGWSIIDNKQKPREGRLRFFTTFFRNIGLDIINPQDRTKRLGTEPIIYEVVPKGSVGKFNLLYLPYWWDSNIYEEIREDIDLLSKLLEGIMFIYGFSAKKDMGYGVIEKVNKGLISYNIGSSLKGDLLFNDFETFTGHIQSLANLLKRVIQERPDGSDKHN